MTCACNLIFPRGKRKACRELQWWLLESRVIKKDCRDMEYSTLVRVGSLHNRIASGLRHAKRSQKQRQVVITIFSSCSNKI